MVDIQNFGFQWVHSFEPCYCVCMYSVLRILIAMWPILSYITEWWIGDYESEGGKD